MINRQMENSFNLPRYEDLMDNESETEVEDTSVLDEPVDTIDEETKAIEEHLREVAELKKTMNKLSLNSIVLDDAGLEEIRTEALNSYKELMEAGYSTEGKHAANFLDPAIQALAIAMETENLKLKRKLGYFDMKNREERMEISRRKLEFLEKGQGVQGEVVSETGVSMNRNDLLALIKEGKTGSSNT